MVWLHGSGAALKPMRIHNTAVEEPDVLLIMLDPCLHLSAGVLDSNPFTFPFIHFTSGPEPGSKTQVNMNPDL